MQGGNFNIIKTVIQVGQFH